MKNSFQLPITQKKKKMKLDEEVGEGDREVQQEEDDFINSISVKDGISSKKKKNNDEIQPLVINLPQESAQHHDKIRNKYKHLFVNNSTTNEENNKEKNNFQNQNNNEKENNNNNNNHDHNNHNHTNGHAEDEEKKLEREAISELLTGELPILLRYRNADLDDVIDEKQKFQLDVSTRPNESTLDQYQKVPVSEFGLASLRGMGWEPGQGVGKKNQKIDPIEFIRRPGFRHGLGHAPALPDVKEKKIHKTR